MDFDTQTSYSEVCIRMTPDLKSVTVIINLYSRGYICHIMEKIGGRDFTFTNPMLMDASGRVLGVRAHKNIPKKVSFEALTASNVCDTNGLILSRNHKRALRLQ